LLGLAVGDAVGTTLEFRIRGHFEPITDMVGRGPFMLDKGQWTDDTSMALCLATSLVEKKGFDAFDQMTKYVQWMEKGYLSSNGVCFDIGNTVKSALMKFKGFKNPFAGSFNANSAGNGSIMRLAPIPMFFFPDLDSTIHYAAESSRTTHGARECLDACCLLASIIFKALQGQDKDVILFPGHPEMESEKIADIARGTYQEKSEDEIAGSGYVVESLEAALWCFWNTDNYRDAILKAANLGDDADTTAAICGQVAGAYYGESGIPKDWLADLAMRQEITELADHLCKHNSAGKIG